MFLQTTVLSSAEDGAVFLFPALIYLPPKCTLPEPQELHLHEEGCWEATVGCTMSPKHTGSWALLAHWELEPSEWKSPWIERPSRFHAVHPAAWDKAKYKPVHASHYLPRYFPLQISGRRAKVWINTLHLLLWKSNFQMTQQCQRVSKQIKSTHKSYYLSMSFCFLLIQKPSYICWWCISRILHSHTLTRGEGAGEKVVAPLFQLRELKQENIGPGLRFPTRSSPSLSLLACKVGLLKG